MHILLTDILTCPRCGPQFGLILLADRIIERRVMEGALGCANCRNRYRIEQGTVRFTEGSSPYVAAAAGEPDGVEAADADAALRVAALLGVTEGPAYVLLAGPASRFAAFVAGIADGIEVIVAAAPGGDLASRPGVNRLDIAAPLPLVTARMAGVALSGEAADALLEEGARVVAPLGRLLLDPAPADAPERLERQGLHVLAQEDRTIVAVNRHAVPRAGPGQT